MHTPLYARPAAHADGGTRCEPSRRVTAPGFAYTPAIHTDLVAKFAAVRAARLAEDAARANAAVRAAKFAAMRQDQQPLALDDAANYPGVPRFLLVGGQSVL